MPPGLCLARAVHAKQRVRFDPEVVCRAAAAQNWLCGGGVVNAVNQQATVNMHTDHFSQYQPSIHRLTRCALQLDNLRFATLESYRAFGHPGHINQP